MTIPGQVYAGGVRRSGVAIECGLVFIEADANLQLCGQKRLAAAER